MKKLIPMLLVLASCASQPVIINNDSKPTWVNLFDSENKIAAAVDTKTNEVQYYQSPEKAFNALYAAYVSLVKKVQEASAPPKTETKKTPVKKETK